MSKLSIIVPVYNVEKYIKRCLESILNEKVDKEIIVVNDGSPDNSEAIINNLQKKHKEIILINQKNQGLGAARNTGIKHATGDYICFIDSDDWINKGTLEKALKLMKKNKLDILYWKINWIFEDGTKKEQQIHSTVYKKLDKIGYLLSDPSACNKLFKTKIFKENNLEFPINCLYEDLAFIPGLVKYVNKIEFTNEISYNYLQRTNSIMNQKKYNPKIMDLITAYNHLYDMLYPEYKQELEYLAINQLIYIRTFELLKYNKKEEIIKCVNEVKNKFPNWKNNGYFKKRNIMIKIYCHLISSKHYFLCKILSFIRSKIRK